MRSFEKEILKNCGNQNKRIRKRKENCENCEEKLIIIKKIHFWCEIKEINFCGLLDVSL